MIQLHGNFKTVKFNIVYCLLTTLDNTLTDYTNLKQATH